MNNNESTHLIFGKDLQGNDITLISPNLQKIFKFLIDIGEELNSFLDIETNIWDMKKNVLNPMLGEWKDMLGLLETNKIPYQCKTSKKTLEDFINFKASLGVRVKMIALFAFMETIFCLITIYDSKLSDEREIIKKSNNDLPKWIGKYILTKRNDFYKQNISRFKKITTKNLILLRNSLTHFFSVSRGIMIFEGDEEMREKFDRLEDIATLSPMELNLLLGGMIRLLYQEWTKDFINNKTDFEEKISFVIKVIEEKAPVLLDGQGEPFKLP